MPTTIHKATKLNSMSIEKLQGINNLAEITFTPHRITGIFGPNCLGKTTILHAIACCYQPFSPQIEGRENYIFSRFFRPNTDATWVGSKLSIKTNFKKDVDSEEEAQINYRKDADRWAPKYTRRHERDVVYIGIDTCVPAVDKEKSTTRVLYTREAINNDKTLPAMADIFNVNYNERAKLYVNEKHRYKGLGVGEIKYSDLSMGAGEQRILCILDAMYSLRKNGLLLIDELDLLLHDDALFRFINIANRHAASKEIQIIFTSHRISLLKLESEINIRHLVKFSGNTYCLTGNSIEAVRRLSGNSTTPIEIYTEDNVSKCIVEHIAGDLAIRKFIKTTLFGAASNAFTVAAGLIIKGENSDHCLIVLDGDKYENADEKQSMIKKILTGNTEIAEEQRRRSLELIQSYATNRKSPEKYIIEMIQSMDENNVPEKLKEMYNELLREANSLDGHDIFLRPIRNLGLEYPEGIRPIIEIAALSEKWDEFVASVKTWLQNQKEQLDERIRLGLTNHRS